MIKLRNKILISLLLFMTILGTGLKCLADWTLVESKDAVIETEFTYKYEDKDGKIKERNTLLPKEERAFQGKTQEYMRKWVEDDDNLDKWLNNDNFIGRMLGSELSNAAVETQKRYAYCIDPTTPASSERINIT